MNPELEKLCKKYEEKFKNSRETLNVVSKDIDMLDKFLQEKSFCLEVGYPVSDDLEILWTKYPDRKGNWRLCARDAKVGLRPLIEHSALVRAECYPHLPDFLEEAAATIPDLPPIKEKQL